MKINFYLKDPNAEQSAVRLVITHRGMVYRKNIGISVLTRQWKKSKKDGQYPTNPKDMEKIKSIRLNLEGKLNEYSTEEDIREAIDRVLEGGDFTGRKMTKDTPTFWEYFDDWTKRPSPVKRQRRSVCHVIENMMGRKADWHEVDSAYYFKLIQKMNELGFSKNYQGSIISKLKTVMSEGFKLKYHKNTDFMNFKKMAELPDTIYLTQNEVDKLYELELTEDIERRCRDLFILGIYTASRFSDYSRLTRKNIKSDFINFIQNKTGESVLIPMSPRVKEILTIYGDKPAYSNQTVFNRKIKEICKKAGMTKNVIVRKSLGTSHETMVTPKYKLVSSHTARRTGATLLYMSGVPLRQCMLITGHRSEANFMRYIRITKEENAQKLADLPFFK